MFFYINSWVDGKHINYHCVWCNVSLASITGVQSHTEELSHISKADFLRKNDIIRDGSNKPRYMCQRCKTGWMTTYVDVKAHIKVIQHKHH